MGIGGEISGTFKNGKVTSIEGTVHEGPFTLNFADGNGNMGIDIWSGSKTFTMLSFTGSLSIRGVKMNVTEGTGINGLKTSKNQMDAYTKMRMHDLQESRKSTLLNKTLRDIKRLK